MRLELGKKLVWFILLFFVCSLFAFYIPSVKGQSSYTIEMNNDTDLWSSHSSTPRNELAMACSFGIDWGYPAFYHNGTSAIITDFNHANLNGTLSSVILQWNGTAYSYTEYFKANLYSVWASTAWNETTLTYYEFFNGSYNPTLEYITSFEMSDSSPDEQYRFNVPLTDFFNSHTGNLTTFRGFILIPDSTMEGTDGFGTASRENTYYPNNRILIYVNGAPSDYYNIEFTSDCWLNGVTSYDILNGETVLISNELVTSEFNNVWIVENQTIRVYGVADEGYYFSSVTFDADNDDYDTSSDYSGADYEVFSDTVITVDFQEWEEEYDNAVPFAVTSDGSSETVMTVSFNGETYLFGDGGYYFYNFSIPYRTIVRLNYENAYKTFSYFSVNYWYIDGTEDFYNYESENNPTEIATKFYGTTERDLKFEVMPVAFFNSPTPTPTTTATPTPTPTPTDGFTNTINFLLDPSIIGLLIVIICGVIGTWASGFVGFSAGITIGSVFTYLAGLLPLWGVIATIVVAGLIFFGGRNQNKQTVGG